MKKQLRKLGSILALYLCIATSCGGGGGGGGTPPAPPTQTDLIAPAILNYSPSTNQSQVNVFSIIQIFFSEPLNPTTVNSITVRLMGPNGDVPSTLNYDAMQDFVTLTPLQGLIPGSTYTIQVSSDIQDLAGNALLQPLSSTFQTAGTNPPLVIRTNPISGAVDVPISSTVSATFDQAIDPLSVTSTHVVVSDSIGPVPGNLSYDSNLHQILFAPVTSFSPSTLITVLISGILNVEGTTMLRSYQYSFITGITPDMTNPNLVSHSPVNGAAGIPLNSVVQLTFDEAIDPSTIDANSFSVQGPGGVPVPGSRTFDLASLTATFTPSGNYAPLTTYNVTVTSSIRDLSGNPLNGPPPFSFSTGIYIPIWGSAIQMEGQIQGTYSGGGSGESTQHQLAIGSNGDVIEVYPKNGVIYAVRTPAGGATGAPVALTNPGATSNPVVAVAANGNAVAAWNFAGDVLASTFTVAGGWQTPVVIDNLNNFVSTPRIAMNDAGTAIVAWSTFYSAFYSDVFAARFSNGSWGAPVNLTTVSSGTQATNVQVGMDPAGNAIAVFELLSSGAPIWSLYAKRYVAATGWVNPITPIEFDNVLDARNPQIAVCSNGDAIATWVQGQVSGIYSIYANHYHAATSTWNATTNLLETTALPTYLPLVAMSATGEGVVAWTQKLSAQVDQVVVNTYLVASGWQSPQLMNSNAFQAGAISLACDPLGNAMVAWRQSNTSTSVWDIYVRSFDLALTSLNSELILGHDPVFSSDTPRVVLSTNSTGALSYRQQDGTAIQSKLLIHLYR